MLPYARVEARVASPEPMAVDELLASCVIVGILIPCLDRLIWMGSKIRETRSALLYHDACIEDGQISGLDEVVDQLLCGQSFLTWIRSPDRARQSRIWLLLKIDRHKIQGPAIIPLFFIKHSTGILSELQGPYLTACRLAD